MIANNGKLPTINLGQAHIAHKDLRPLSVRLARSASRSLFPGLLTRSDLSSLKHRP